MSSNLIDKYFDVWYQILEHLRDGISGCILHRWSMYYHLLCPIPCCIQRMSNHHLVHYSELFSSISLPFSISHFFCFPSRNTSLHFIGSFFCVVQLAGHFWQFRYWFTCDIIICFSTAIPQFYTVPQVSAIQNYLLL